MAIEVRKYDISNAVPNNVRDDFKGMTIENIRDELEGNRLPVVSVCMNLTSDFNKSSIVRASNAFLGKEVFIVGKRKLDRRGAVGTLHYENIRMCPDIDEVINYLRENDYTIFAVDNTPEFNATPVYDVDMPVKTAFIYGEEQLGLSPDVVAKCDAAVYIPQYGSVRSLNVAQAAAIMLSEYTRRHRVL